MQHSTDFEEINKQLLLLQQERDALKVEVQALRLELIQQYTSSSSTTSPFEKVAKLSNPEIARYGRQLILPEFGIKVVGAGGLGSPCALYLGSAGVGRLGIVDHDTVDISNLHRQIIHNEARQGVSKAQSAALSIQLINPHCKVAVYDLVLDSSNAQPIIDEYDIVVDATDNVATRYLLNDACVLGKKPLVSGSALRLDGQLTIYNYRGGPCYRCLFPTPPPAATVTNCSDGGVLGVVPGVIGCLQALEAIKIATHMNENELPTMTLFSANSSTMFRTIKLRKKKSDCIMCGDAPTITKLIDYVRFCGSSATDKTPDLFLIPFNERITCETYKQILDNHTPHVLLDVREQVQFDICSLPDSINIPLKDLPKELDQIRSVLGEEKSKPIYVLCRRGNDSQPAARILQEAHVTSGEIKDIVGGLEKCIVVAADLASGIGLNGSLPWRLRKDMAFFAKLTSKIVSREPSSQVNACIMGRRTWESIPAKFRPLSNRFNIIVSRDPHYLDDKAERNNPLVALAPSFDSALELAKKLQGPKETTESVQVGRVFLIGGSQLYNGGIQSKYCKNIILTRIQATVKCDTFFPEIKDTEYTLLASTAGHEFLEDFLDEKVEGGLITEGEYQFEYTVYTRKVAAM
ncbi:Molybdenum cofactor synthesis protein 3 [Podila epigama]|nr:Molybdenum cofactor synthesis protein 3 [Podila epigama]